MELREPGTYWLAPHVHVCRSGGNVVLLDLKHDKYIGVTGNVMDALAGTLAGWRVSEPARAATGIEQNTLLTNLRTNGMVTSDAHAGKPAVPVSTPRPDSALIEGYRKSPVRVRTIDVARFTAAACSARAQMRWLSLEKIVARTRAHRKTRWLFDLGRTRECVQIFRRLRPFLYTGHDACLLDSFTLLLFLTRYGFAPRWVFGVATSPFAAHCWLQEGSVVINDTPERVRSFTPIMVV